jgi:hypothetical protein
MKRVTGIGGIFQATPRRPMRVDCRARLAAIALSLFMGAAAAADRQGWLVLERVGTDQPEILSVVRELPAPAVRQKFPVLVEVKWGYKALANGMPAEGELALGDRLYDALDGIFGAGGVHVMTRTGDGARWMYYYVDNAERHGEAIRNFFQSLPPMPVQVQARDEPDWETVVEVRDAIK